DRGSHSRVMRDIGPIYPYYEPGHASAGVRDFNRFRVAGHHMFGRMANRHPWRGQRVHAVFERWWALLAGQLPPEQERSVRAPSMVQMGSLREVGHERTSGADRLDGHSGVGFVHQSVLSWRSVWPIAQQVGRADHQDIG